MGSNIYKNPPLREAVFDVKFTGDSETPPEKFEELFTRLKSEYPNNEDMFFQQVSFDIRGGEEPKIATDGGKNGIKLTSRDGSIVVQFRKDGLTFSKLPPYLGWRSFSKEAKKIYDIYVEVLNPRQVNRIALRYINGIEILTPVFDIKDYFNTTIEIGAQLPQQLAQFFLRAVIVDDVSKDVISVINQTIDGTGVSGGTVVIFDIDSFQQNISLDPKNSAIWDNVELIKDVRTKIFEGSITEKTRALFN